MNIFEDHGNSYIYYVAGIIPRILTPHLVTAY